MTKDKTPGVPDPMKIPLNIPILGGQGGQKKIGLQDAIQGLMQQVGNLTAGVDQLTHANNNLAMELEMLKKRVDALENKATLLPGKIEITVKHEQSPLYSQMSDT